MTEGELEEFERVAVLLHHTNHTPAILLLAAEVRRLRGWGKPTDPHDADGFVDPPARFQPPGAASA